jgi:hypothetical protein
MRNPAAHGAGAPVAIIAIPARNEEECLPECLDALAQQRGGVPFAVVVFANNCDDHTVEAARAMQPRLPFRLRVEAVSLPEGCRTAGHARRGAMDLAGAMAEADHALLLSTDADARPRPDWLANMRRHVAAGADAVAGRAIMTEAEAACLPPALRHRLRREAYLARLMDRIAAALDDIPWDPWPRHCGHWGANFAVRAATYARCGGVPKVPLAEDRAFFSLLESHDARIRHAEDCIVEVSARLQGRAPGGMADVLERRAHGEDPLCDAVIEPLAHAMRRHRLHAALRRMPDPDGRPRLARRLGVTGHELEAALHCADAGQAWASLLGSAPALREMRLPHAGLERQIAAAQRVISRLCPGEAVPQPATEETLV